MFCSNCGTEVKEDAVFCQNCGTRLMDSPFSQGSAIPSVAEEGNRLEIVRYNITKCPQCGSEMNEKTVVCIKCGCAIPNTDTYRDGKTIENDSIVRGVSQRIKINGIIWVVIGITQILWGLFVNWYVLVVGVMNIVSAVQDLNYSRLFPQNPVGIVDKVKPLVSSIVVLAYNLFFGGVIGVTGSVYYLVAVRGYVVENEKLFLEIENQQIINNG